MAKQPAKELTFPEKFKQLLRFKNASQTSATGTVIKQRAAEDFIVTPDIVKEIGPDSSIGQRTKTLKRLTEELNGKRIEENAIETVWLHIKDLFNAQNTRSNRQLAFSVIISIVQTQYDSLNLMRAQFFLLVSNHDVSEDLTERIELLKFLSKHGREIEHFEDEIGPFLLKFTYLALASSSALDFLYILVNLIKFHSTYLDKSVVAKIVWLTCHYATRTTSCDGVFLCLQVLETVICYSCLPSESLLVIINTLCRTVNVEKFSQISWKLMRNLLGTHLGHSSLYVMCNILQQSSNRDNGPLLRGAVFFIGMSLWGSQKVVSLKFTHSIVLPYFLQALECDITKVAMEVSLSIERLVRKYGPTLKIGTWQLVIDILDALIMHTMRKTTTEAAILSSNVHEILSIIEELHTQNKYNGCEKRLFSIIEKCAAKRPESSVLRLVDFRAQSISPLKSLWMASLKKLLDTYFNQESRPAIRVRVLEILGRVREENRNIYEDDIVERIILPTLSSVDSDKDSTVRSAAVQLLINVALDCGSKQCLEILEILSKVVSHPFDHSHYPGGKLEAQETVHVINEHEILDVKTAVIGLIELFKKKIYVLPSTVAVTAFKILIRHLHSQYESSVISKDASLLRRLIFECLLEIRANESHQLGVVNLSEKVTNYSPYLLCSSGDKHAYGAISPPLSSPTVFAYPPCTPSYLNLEPFFHIITVCLKQEKDWSVLKHVLLELPKLLRNKTLLLSTPGSVSSVAESVCSLLSNRSLKLPETLRNAPVTLARAEFHLHVYPIQVALVSYHKYLERNMQVLLVTCLRHGLNSKCARACIVALTVCILEMMDTMYKLLPDTLLGLSKISATVNIAIPILEFLSNLIRLPKLYASFVQDQYMSIFAISLPYTNPFKFNHYTVSLAHHVIAMWFIKCRLPFRKDFVPFIVKGLRNNVLVPFDEGAAIADNRHQTDKPDSEQSAATTSRRNDIPQTLSTFHKELTETCIDLMSRYTFACCSTLPKRSPIAEFLLKSDQRAMWLLGNAIITITTSGCNTKASKYGMCDKCYASCKNDQPDRSEAAAAEEAPTSVLDSRVQGNYQNRRRHRSDVLRSLSYDAQDHVPRAKDDIQLKVGWRNQASLDGGVTSDDLEPLKLTGSDSGLSQICSCWCQGWAEVLIRRPTGNSSWVMKIQNQLHPSGNLDFPVSDVATLLLSYRWQTSNEKTRKPVNKFGHERIDSESLEESECDTAVQQLKPPLGGCEEEETLAANSAAASEADLTEKQPSGVESAATPEKLIECPKYDDTLIPVQISEKEKPEILNLDVSDAASEQQMQADDKIKTGPCITPVKPTLRKISSSPDIRMECESRAISTKSEATASSSESAKAPVAKTCSDGDTKTISFAKTGSDGDSKTIQSENPTQPKDEAATEELAERLLQKVGTYEPPPLPLPAELPSSEALRYERVSSPDVRLGLSESRRFRRGSGMEGRQLRLMDPTDYHRAMSPVPNTGSAPLSPLPLSQAAGHLDLPPVRRDRGHTISVMSPVRHKWLPGTSAAQQQRIQEGQHQGINPSFVFLQLFYSFRFGVTSDRPIFLPKSESVDRAIKVIDHIPPYDTHKIGVLYVGPGQVESEAAILANEFGSIRYINFLHGLGRLVRLQTVNPQEIYVGGLDTSGPDGKFAYVWQDDVMQVVFHVATLMPSKKTDPSCNQKKLHIGNDFVSIVYNDSGQEYNIRTIKGQFIYACVVIQPLDQDSNLICLKTKPELSDLTGSGDPKIVSDNNLATLVRQLALHADLASMILQNQQRSPNVPYASNWLERLRLIRRLREKRRQEAPPPLDDDSPGPESGGPAAAPGAAGWSKQSDLDDFTGFV